MAWSVKIDKIMRITFLSFTLILIFVAMIPCEEPPNIQDLTLQREEVNSTNDPTPEDVDSLFNEDEISEENEENGEETPPRSQRKLLEMENGQRNGRRSKDLAFRIENRHGVGEHVHSTMSIETMCLFMTFGLVVVQSIMIWELDITTIVYVSSLVVFVMDRYSNTPLHTPHSLSKIISYGILIHTNSILIAPALDLCTCMQQGSKSRLSSFSQVLSNFHSRRNLRESLS